MNKSTYNTYFYVNLFIFYTLRFFKTLYGVKIFNFVIFNI